ncbi:hypothetical protein BDR03DRAFT_936857 [Suillus americanus]|nr:hypothetical protein BDR03DRAFT_936857 [Suillus americanus]
MTLTISIKDKSTNLENSGHQMMHGRFSPIIAASDKTPVTKHMGGLKMHPLFLTIGNIQGDVRVKVMSHAWQCTAFMPIPTFIVNSNFQTLLQSCLWHKCIDLVCSNLKIMGHKLDVRFKSHHKCTGVRHFSEHQDIQHTIVLMLWGIASSGFICAVQAMIDFIDLAQNPLPSESSIASMTQALQDFHDNKQAILDTEARQGKSGAKDDFFIPKLELMQSFARAISHVGTLMQWTADDPLINAIVMEDEEITSTETDPAFAWVSNANQAAQLHLQALRPIHNHFLKGILSDNAQIAFNVNMKADHSRLDMSQLQSLYNISDFYHALHLYVTRNGCILPGQLSFNTWMKFRIQLHSTFHACRIMPSHQIHAEPPSSNFLRGNCDVVLFNQRVNGGSHVAQVQTIFQPTLPKGSRAQVTKCLSQPLVYIQLFDFVMSGSKPSMGMWIVR